MQQGYNVVIADTTCFIILHKIGKLELLQQLFNQVTTTTIIEQEFGKQLPEWVNIVSPTDVHYQQILEVEIDAGKQVPLL